MKLLDWFKSAVAVVKMPAEQPKAEAQPHEPARNGGAPDDTAAAVPPQTKSESAAPIARMPPRPLDVPPAPPLHVEPEAPIARTPPRPLDVAPVPPLHVEPEAPIAVAPARSIEIEPEEADEPEAPAGSEAAISIEPRAREPSALPDQDEIDRRRGLVRRFFNDYWSSVDEKPTSFAERLDGAEGYINERVAAGGEVWQLDSATRKQLGLPQARKR